MSGTPSILEAFDDYHIVGQGLAGTLTAEMLLEEDLPLKIQDVSMDGRATVVAPGIINPLPGRKLKPIANVDELFARARTCYEDYQNELETKIWHDSAILRLLNEPEQEDYMERMVADPEANRFMEKTVGEGDYPFVTAEYGGFVTKPAAWVDLPKLISAFRQRFLNQNLLIESEVTPSILDLVTNKPKTAFIFAEGWRMGLNAVWNFIPRNPAKGEMLIVEFKEDIPRDFIYNKSCWAQPIEDTLWRVGATYSWSAMDSIPSLTSASELHRKLKRLTSVPYKTHDQRAGVRPIVDDYNPVIGRHPKLSNCFIVNGLGSKGAILAPSAVRNFVNFLKGHDILKPEWNVSRFYSHYRG